MDHKYWEEQLQAYLDHELDPADYRAVEKHVGECSECKTQFDYFSALKARLRAHAETVTIPPIVEERLHSQFTEKKLFPFRQSWIVGTLSLAAMFVLGLLVAPFLTPGLIFTEGTFEGKIVCHDCTVAYQAGLDRGVLCQDGHRLGLVTDHGKLYRFASDEIGQIYTTDPSLYGDTVRVTGEVLKSRGLIRIQKLEHLTPKRASLW